MPGKNVACSYCSKMMRSDNLKNHIIKIHTKDTNNPTAIGIKSSSSTVKHPDSVIGQKRLADIYNVPTQAPPTSEVTGSFFEPSSKNPKLEMLADALINSSPRTTGDLMKPALSPHTLVADMKPPTPPSNVVADIFKKELPVFDKKLSSLPPVAEIFQTKSPPRSKGDIIGYSDEDDDDSSDAESENNDVEDFVLPDTVEGVRDRFNKLYVGFVRKKKYENINELEFLLDEMFRQEAIDPAEYTQMNTILTKKEYQTIDREEKDDEEEENVENSALQYLVLHDKEELEELMEDIKEEIDVEFMDIVVDIERLVKQFFVNERVDGQPIRPRINTLLNQLACSNIPISKQHRIKMLLDDIERNRYRVKEIFQRLTFAKDKEGMQDIVKMLGREGHLSDEQFEQLLEMEDPDVEKIKDIIVETKVGEGLNLLPRSIYNLRHALQSLLVDLKENGSALLKTKIAEIMEELLRRNAIRSEEYGNLKELIV